VILPKQLLSAAMSSGSGVGLEHLLRDNYETPLFAPAISQGSSHPERIAQLLKLSMSDFKAHARNLASPDELSVYIAKRLMDQLAPSLLWVTLHDIDIAHSGAYSLYLDGICRSDRLCAAIWQAIQDSPEYCGRTTLLILPDFGRDADTNPAGNGFQHHRTGDALSRTTWLLALGPGVREGAVVNRPVDSLDLVPTLGKLLNFSPSLAQGRPLVEVL